MRRAVFTLLMTPFLMGPVMPAMAAEHDTEDKMRAIRQMFGSAAAEEEYYRIDRLLTTATGSQLPIHKAPSVASVITDREIKAMGATTLDDILETVPGLHVGASSSAFLSPIYSIRGIHTQANPQVLLLYNGKPYQLPNNGARALGFRVPVAAISRVEVVRGPGSAIHGADAFAGTINVITKDGFEIDGTEAGVRAGSFDSYDTWLQYGGQINGYNLALSLEIQQSQGDSKRIIGQDLQSYLDSPLVYNTNASLAPGAMDTDFEIYDAHFSLAKNNFSLQSWLYDIEDAASAAGMLNALAPNNNPTFLQFMTIASYTSQHLLTGWDVTCDLTYVYQNVDAFYHLLPAGSLQAIGTDGNSPPTAATLPRSLVLYTDGSYGNPKMLDQTTSLDVTLLSRDLGPHRWRLGSGLSFQSDDVSQYKNNGPGVLDSGTASLQSFPNINLIGPGLTDVSNTPYVWLPDNSRTSLYASLQDEWALTSGWNLTAGIRYDHYSDFGDTINPRAALVWETRYDLTSKLMYGRAFRHPNFIEQFSQNNPSVLGNANLDPETIQVLELAFDWQPSARYHSILSLFSYGIDGLIEYVADPTGTKTAQNFKDQDGYGFELEGEWRPTDSITIGGTFAYQRSRDAVTRQLTPDAPGMQASLSASWRFLPDWLLDSRYTWIGDRRRADNDSRPAISNISKVDLTLRRNNIATHWEFAVAVRNLTNHDIREPYAKLIPMVAVPGDYPMEGRSVWGEISYRF